MKKITIHVDDYTRSDGTEVSGYDRDVEVRDLTEEELAKREDAKKRLEVNGDNNEISTTIEKGKKDGIIPQEWTEDDIIGLSGLENKDEIISLQVFGNSDLPKLIIETNKFKAERTFDIEGKSVLNELLVVKEEFRGQGVGSSMLLKQVETASSLGFERISLYGAANIGGSPANGYYTWPRLGFETIDKKSLLEYNSYDKNPKINKADSFHKLMSTQEGRDYWRNDGRFVPRDRVYEMEFDLSQDSKSKEILKAYIKSKGG